MVHKVCKWCKNNLFITIAFGVFTLLILPLAISVFIKSENMSPEEKAGRAAQMHHEDVEDICSHLVDRTKKDGVRAGIDWDMEECVLVTQVNLKTSGEDNPLIGEYRVKANNLQDGGNENIFGDPIIKDSEEKEVEGKIQKLCYEGKPVQMRVWDGSDPGRAPYPIRVIPYYK